MASPEGTTELSAAESLALIEDQRAQVGRELDVNPVVLYATWGVAWTLGFTAFALIAGEVVAAPRWVGVIIFFALMIAAMVITTAHITRVTRGVRGVSSEVGAMYGWSWALGFGALVTINTGLSRLSLTDDQMAVLWPASSLLIVGVLYGGFLVAAAWFALRRNRAVAA